MRKYVIIIIAAAVILEIMTLVKYSQPLMRYISNSAGSLTQAALELVIIVGAIVLIVSSVLR